MDDLYNNDDSFGGVALSDDDLGADEEELEGLDDETSDDDAFGGDDEGE